LIEVGSDLLQRLRVARERSDLGVGYAPTSDPDRGYRSADDRS
jgi:hypothetical protein